MLGARDFDKLPNRVELPADLAAVLYDSMKGQEEWDIMHHMRAELGTQTVNLPAHMIVLIYDRLLEKKEMNVMTELYRILNEQVKHA